ncbi:MAG: 3-hydroxybutyryl-CoA dehydrogenase [Candidatus Marinimicrobia bacterium]|nr:3-hydroxybutyryl-CoA dehydrogenase [Candidatus Neomarinimicrobiota bacterium]
MAHNIETIAVIGAGTMGNGIAHVLALSHRQVVLIDLDDTRLGQALDTIAANMARQVKKGTLGQDEADRALEAISTATSLEAAAPVDLAIEAATENPGLKRKIFADLDRICSAGVILASNTSSISIASLAAVTGRASEVIGMHFMNPVPVMDLVEVILGSETSAETRNTVAALARAMGKTPVTVNDAPGFVANRLLMPMINEAIICLDTGVAQAEAIDEIMVLGMSHPMGPLKLADLIGLDTCLAIMQVLHRDLKDDKYAPSPLLGKMVADGRLGKKTGSGFYAYP